MAYISFRLTVSISLGVVTMAVICVVDTTVDVVVTMAGAQRSALISMCRATIDIDIILTPIVVSSS